MDPVIDLGLAQTKMQSQQGLEFIGLIIGENEKSLSSIEWSLPWVPPPGLRRLCCPSTVVFWEAAS